METRGTTVTAPAAYKTGPLSITPLHPGLLCSNRRTTVHNSTPDIRIVGLKDDPSPPKHAHMQTFSLIHPSTPQIADSSSNVKLFSNYVDNHVADRQLRGH